MTPEPAADQQEFTFQDCFARWDGQRLEVGNKGFRRSWVLGPAGLQADSLRHRSAEREWLARPARTASPVGTAGNFPAEGLEFCDESGAALPTEAPSLRVELKAPDGQAFRVQVFPRMPACCMQLIDPSSPAAGNAADRVQTTATGVELADAADRAGQLGLPLADLMEYIEPASTHLKLTHVRLVDQTDVHNELVFEDEWLVHPNEAKLTLQGNLFVLSDPLTGQGLILLKHAPLPSARPGGEGVDLRMFGTSACHPGRGDRPFGPKHPDWPLAFRVGLYGHACGPDVPEGYRWAVICFDGGRDGCTEALHLYQRAVSRPDLSRHGVLVTNTWGDRNRDGRIRESFLLEEVAAAAKLGAHVMQIDDGWQRGTTANSVNAGGVWEGFWASDAQFWQPHPERLPNGLDPIVEAARQAGMSLGLWFAPDSSDEFANWRRDADAIVHLNDRYRVQHIKIDGVRAPTRVAGANLEKFFRAVHEDTHGAVVFDLDVTAQIRPGYFGLCEAGQLFLENRYTDFRRYWPHQTLRNLWKLSHWVDPLRLRMEWLNPARNADLYHGDPLAPDQYSPDYLFATVMFSAPLGWFEVSNLPDSVLSKTSRLVRIWREHREAIFTGTIHPIGQAPDGEAWTGFCSVSGDGRSVYLLIFREMNGNPGWSLELPMVPDRSWAVEKLAGSGELELTGRRLHVKLPRRRQYVLARARFG